VLEVVDEFTLATIEYLQDHPTKMDMAQMMELLLANMKSILLTPNVTAMVFRSDK
jgi:hypothetical protein